MNQIGRNEPCICGSGLKFKKCCDLKRNQSENPTILETGYLLSHKVSKNRLNFEGIAALKPNELNSFLQTSAKTVEEFVRQEFPEQVSIQRIDGDILEMKFMGTDHRYRPTYSSLKELEPEGQIESDCSECLTAAGKYCPHQQAAWFILWNSLHPEFSFVASQEFGLKLQTYRDERRKRAKALESELQKILDVRLQRIYLFAAPPAAFEDKEDSPIVASENSQKSSTPAFTTKVSKSAWPSFKKSNIQKKRKLFVEYDAPHVSEYSPLSLFWQQKGHPYLMGVADLNEQLNVIWYQFSDGACISVSEILLTAYRYLLPPNLLPGEYESSRGVEILRKQGSQLFENESSIATKLAELKIKVPKALNLNDTADSGFGFSGRLLELVNPIIHSSFAHQALANIELSIVLGTYEKPVAILPIEKIESGQRNSLFWRLTTHSDPSLKVADDLHWLDLIGINEISSSSVRLFNDFAFDLQSGILSFYPVANDLRLTIFNDRDRLNTSPVNGDRKVKPISSVPHEQLFLRKEFRTTSQNRLKPFIRGLKRCELPVFIGAKKSAVLADSRARINLQNNNLVLSRLIQLNHQTLDQPLTWNLSDPGQKWLRALSNGFLTYFDIDANSFSSRSNKEEDRRFLKHIGIFHLVFFETCSVVLTGSLSDGRPAANAREILPLIETQILRLFIKDKKIGQFDDSLSTVLSKKVISKLQEVIQIIFEMAQEEEQFYLTPGQISVRNFLIADLQFLYAILRQAILVSQGVCLTKARSDLFSKLDGNRQMQDSWGPRSQFKDVIFTQDDPFAVASTYSAFIANFDLSTLFPNSADAFGVLQTLYRFGFLIYLDGQRIEALSVDDLRAEIDITTENAGGTDHRGPIDWFELHPRIFLHGKEVETKEVALNLEQGMVLYKGKHYLVPTQQLPSLKRLEGFWKRLQSGKKGKQNTFSEKVTHLPRHQFLEMLSLRSAGVTVQGGREWQEIAQFYDGLGTSKRTVALPKTVRGILKPFQKIGVQWLYDLYQLRLGAVLADDMGLGKTLQALVFLETLRKERQLGHALAVVPTSLAYNWSVEGLKFTPDLPLHVFSSQDKIATDHFLSQNSGALVIVTYGLLTEHQEFFDKYNWNIIIFDEAQYLKNIAAKRTSSARSIQARYKICLSGTPMENHYGDYFSLVDLVVPGALGNIDDFRSRYVNPPSIRSEDIEELKLKTKPIVLRRKKKDVLLELPEKQESKIMIDFEAKQKKLYRDIAVSYNQVVMEAIREKGEANCQLQMLTALLRLRQACSDPAALPNVSYLQVPPKIETLLQSLKEIVDSGESALVFTQFVSTLNRTVQELQIAEIPVYSIQGKDSQKSRERAIENFQLNTNGSVMVMTLKTGGVGLNLTKASYVFHLEPWWNPAAEDQGTDRAHRMGQTKSVQVFRYIMHDSVEEKIETLKAKKQSKFSALFSETESIQIVATEPQNPQSRLSKEDFQFLLQT